MEVSGGSVVPEMSPRDSVEPRNIVGKGNAPAGILLTTAARSFDAQLLHSSPQGVGMQAKDKGRATGSVDHPACLVEDLMNVSPLHLL